MTTLTMANGSEFQIDESVESFLRRVGEVSPSPWVSITLKCGSTVWINNFVIVYIKSNV